ncbi:hypothetical protein GTO27_09340 [Candidatus Bathyarchaeota archaeon]|nr:hypothetical protein [Candidatus Bathyarchaeota archaeon]
MKKKTFVCILMLVVIIAMSTSLFVSGREIDHPPMPEEEDYEVTFVGVVYDAHANTSTWTYNVTCNGDPEISHIDFELKERCDPPLTAIVDAGPDPWEIVDPDPTTEVTGIKFDIPVAKGETITVWFTLEGLWAVNDIEVWIKAGKQDPYAGPSYLPEGPACFFIPEVPLGPIATILAAFAALGLVARAKIFSN